MSESQTAYSAFISHASADGEKAREICESLESRGFRCWIAPRDIRAGREYADEIIRGIQESRCMVLLLSDAANQSAFVRREVERAVSKRKPVFPMRLEEVLPSPGLELFVSTTHWIDAWSGDMLEHVNRLARDLSDDAVVEKATAVSRKIARRRQMPKWLVGAAAFLAIIAAIVIGNLLTGNRGGSSPQPGGMIMHGPGSAEVIAEMQKTHQKILDDTGVDFASITRDDVTVASYTRRNSSEVGLNIKRSADLELLAMYADLFIAIDDGPFKRAGSGVEEQVSPSRLDQQALAAAKEIRVRYDFKTGKSLGPFAYPFNAGNAVLETYKAAALAVDTWLDFHGGAGGYATFARLADFYPAVLRVKYGSAPDKLDFVIDIEPAASTDRMEIQRHSRNYWLDYLPYEQGPDAAYVQLDFRDGTSSPVRQVNLQGGYLSENYRSVVLRPVESPEGQAPVILVATFDAAQSKMTYRPLVPPMKTEKVMYTFDEAGFLEAQMETRGGQGADVYPARGFTFEGPVADSTIRMSAELDGGKTLGPFRYQLHRAGDVAQATHKKRLLERLSEAMVAVRIPPPVQLREGASITEATKHSYLTSQHQENVRRLAGLPRMSEEVMEAIATGDVVLCLPVRDARKGDYADWSTVREIRLGTQPGELSIIVPIQIESAAPDASGGPARNGLPSRRGRAKPATPNDTLPGFAALPADAQAVYAQIVFHDESATDPVRVPIQESDAPGG